jgi:phosphate transport system substrate-binding protein
MSQKKDTLILILSLLITFAILGGGYWWFMLRNQQTVSDAIPSNDTPSPTNSDSGETLPPPNSPLAFDPPAQVPTGTTVKINGSTTMVQINQALKNSFEQRFAGTIVDTEAKGSDQGIQSLLRGQIDIAAISRPLHETEKQQGLIAVPVSEDAIAIVVGSNNTFRRGLTQQQVRDIFQGKISNWSVVGGQNSTIQLINRPEVSGTRQAFQELVLKGGAFANSANIKTMDRDATTPILQILGTDGISYATYTQVANQQTVRTVAVDGLTPEANNYPYQRTLYYVYKDPPNPAVQAFLGYVTSPLGRKVIQEINQ